MDQSFCASCGQKARENSNRSMGLLVSEFLTNIFFLDNRFFVSIGYLIRFPGRMTVEYLNGRRKKFLSPVSFFLLFNLIYFFLSPLSDYSLPLYDQVNSQPYSTWIKEWVVEKLEKEAIEESVYIADYQHQSDTISKSVMIINIPLMALFIYMLTFKRRRFYYDSLIFSFHYFSLFMLSWILLDVVGDVLEFLLTDSYSNLSMYVFLLFTFIMPLVYAIFSMKVYLKTSWPLAILSGLWAMATVFIANLFYRFLIFLLAFWST